MIEFLLIILGVRRQAKRVQLATLILRKDAQQAKFYKQPDMHDYLIALADLIDDGKDGL